MLKKKKEEKLMANIEKKFTETPVGDEMKNLILDNTRYTWDPYDTLATAEMVFLGISKFLRSVKSSTDSNAAALVVRDNNNNFVFAAVIRYKDNTEAENMPGNWNLSYTMNEEDIKDVSVIHLHTNYSLSTFVDEISRKKHNMGLINREFAPDMIQFLIRAVVNVLDKNALPEGQGQFSINLEDIFIATVEVIDGNKEFAFTPGAVSKQYIKADVEIQK